MAHWNKYSSQRADLVFGRWTWLIGLPLAALTLAQVYFGLNPELLLGWAMGQHSAGTRCSVAIKS